MKDQEQKNPRNKRLLTYYLILGACILVIAAIAVAVTLSVTLGDKAGNITIDAGENEADDGAEEEEGEETEDTVTDTSFYMPVSVVNAINSYGFYYNSTLNKYYVHTGIDFAADAGTEVFAVLDGTVESIYTGDILTGTTITISHDNGLKTVYTFVDAAEGLSVGDTVAKGDVIGTVSEATGNEYKDGAHLHFEVYLNDVAVDPEIYLDIDGK